MKDKIQHGVFHSQTPDIQTDEYIKSRLQEEDQIGVRLTPHVMEMQAKVACAIRDSFPIVDNRSFIEIGSGTGVTTETVLNTINRIRITGVDTSKSRLERAAVRLKHQNGRFDLINIEAGEYFSKLEPESVDCVFTAFSLHNLPIDLRKPILQGVYRALKPEGVFIDADKHGFIEATKNETTFSTQMSLIRKNFEDNPTFGEQWVDHYQKDKEIDMPREEYLKYLQTVGFQTQTVYENGLEIVIIAKK